MRKGQHVIFRSVMVIAMACWLGASVFSIVPAFVPNTSDISMIQNWQSNLSYLFSTCVGTIIGMLMNRS